MTIALPLPERASTWWRAKTRRERAVLMAFAAVVLAALLWLLAWRPLVQDARRLERESERRDRALVRSGLRPAVTELAWQGRRVRITLASASFATMVASLEDLQREAGLRVVEATFSALESPRRVRAEIVLASG